MEFQILCCNLSQVINLPKSLNLIEAQRALISLLDVSSRMDGDATGICIGSGGHQFRTGGFSQRITLGGNYE